MLKEYLTFHCLCSFLTVSCRFCCSCTGKMSVSSSQAFRNALSTLWSSCPKNSCGIANKPKKTQHIQHTELFIYLMNTIFCSRFLLTVCFLSRSSGFPLSVIELRAILRTFSSSDRDSSNRFSRLLLASTCFFHSVVSFIMAFRHINMDSYALIFVIMYSHTGALDDPESPLYKNIVHIRSCWLVTLGCNSFVRITHLWGGLKFCHSLLQERCVQVSQGFAAL